MSENHTKENMDHIFFLEEQKVIITDIKADGFILDIGDKRRRIHFQWACNRSFRHAAEQLAIASSPQADWAAAYFASALSRGLRKYHAHLCLVNRWLGIIWKMWQTH